MENELEIKNIDKYIKDTEHKIIITNNLEEIKKIKDDVNNIYILLFNNNSKDENIAKITNILSKIEAKETQIEALNLLKQNTELLKESKETLDKAIKLLEILEN